MKKLYYIIIFLTLFTKICGQPHGLRNFGSNCYVNSVIQAFSALNPVTTYLLSLDLNNTYKHALAGPPQEANIAYYYPIFLKQLKLLPATPKDTWHAANTLDYLGFVQGFKPTVLETPPSQVTKDTAFIDIQELFDGTSKATPFPFTKNDIHYVQRLNTFYTKGLAPFLYRAVFRTIELPANEKDLTDSLASCPQEDVPEFIERLLINGLISKDIRYGFSNDIQALQALENHPLGTMFGIEITKLVKCMASGYTGSIIDHVAQLNLETVDEGQRAFITLQKCIDNLLSMRTIKFTPPGFTRGQACNEQTQLTQLSDIVMITLNRFSWDKTAQKGIKHNHKIAVPLEYNFAPHLPKNYKNQTKYRLVAAIEHLGDFGSGHYIAYVKQENQWYICNDEHVFAVNATGIADYSNKWGAASNEHRGIDYAYVYFYQSETPIQPKIPSGTNKPPLQKDNIKQLIERIHTLTNKLKNLEQFLKK